LWCKNTKIKRKIDLLLMPYGQNGMIWEFACYWCWCPTGNDFEFRLCFYDVDALRVYWFYFMRFFYWCLCPTGNIE